MSRSVLFLALLFAGGGVAASAAPAKKPVDPWKLVRAPAPGKPESIGDYDAGCVRGAVRLPLSGPGWEVMRPSRRRYYGHPRMIAFLQTLALHVSEAGLGRLLIGDIGMARGGPTLSGHASHQTGLDVDIWYRQLKPAVRVSMRERERWSSPRMVTPDFRGLNRHWNPNEIKILRLAASDPNVDRIFVDPVIKQTICKLYPGQPWVAHLRPWWGHDDHFHVRLTCTPGDTLCTTKADPLPPGDSCDATLADWLTPQSQEHARKLRTEVGPPPTMPQLPAACEAVLAEKPAALYSSAKPPKAR